MKGSQIWGSENGMHFIAGKSGSKIGGVFFIARKSGVTFLMKFGEICKSGKSGSKVIFGIGWEIGKKDGRNKIGDVEILGMGKCTGGHETLAILVTLLISCNILFLRY